MKVKFPTDDQIINLLYSLNAQYKGYEVIKGKNRTTNKI